MIKRGFLRSSEGIFTLAPRVTVVGRASTDFIIQNITVDPQHAIIEYIDGEDCFVLKDLNSTHGTYVNECRIQNASVRLTDGDILKFGFSPGQYEFHSEDLVTEDYDTTTTYSQIQLSQRPPIQTQVTSLPVINYAHPQSMQQRHTVSGFGPWSQLPRTPSSNPRFVRPSSTNSSNRRQITPNAPIGSSSSSSTYRKGSVSGPIKQFLADNRTLPADEASNPELTNESDRLRYLENQNQEKSRQINNLFQQNNELLNDREKTMNEEVFNQIKDLTEEVSRKCNEVDRLQKLVERLSENTNRVNSNSSNYDTDIALLRQEIEKSRKDLQISNGLVTTLQRDLSNRDETIKQLNKDFERLNNEMAEKDISVSVLMCKLSKLNNAQEQIETEQIEKQDRQKEMIIISEKLKATETCCQEKEEKIISLTSLNEELKQSVKSNMDSILNLNKKLEDSDKLVADFKQSEISLKADLKSFKNKDENFRSKINHVALSTPGFKSENALLKDEELIEIMKDLVKSKVEHDLRICEKQKLIDAEVLKQRQMYDHVDEFSLKLRMFVENLNSGERTSNKVDDVVNAIKSIPSDDLLKSLKEIIIESFQHEMSFLSALESCISDAGPELVNLSLSECFKRIIERSIEAVESRQKTTNDLSEALQTHEEQLMKVKKDFEEESNHKILEAIANENSRLEAEKKLAIMEIIGNEQQKKEQFSKECEAKIKYYEDIIADLEQTLKKKEKIYQENVIALDEKKGICNFLEKQLNDVTESKNILEQSLCEQFDTLNQKWKTEIEGYKEEITQHSITINALNVRLIKLDKENKDLLNQVTKIRTEKKQKNTKATIDIEEKNPVLGIEINNFNVTIANLERCVSALRHENVFLKNRNREHEDTMKGLNMDLAGAEARLSDLKGELSESQKNEIDTLKIDMQKHEENSNALRVQLSKMSIIVDNLVQELEDKKIENKNLTDQMAEEKIKVKDKESQIQDLETNYNYEKDNWTHHINQIEQEGRVSTELATLGSQCRGDRHIQIIDSQKMALMELRQKIKTMDLTRTPNANAPEISQQMLQLKKEMAELRAKQSLKESSPSGIPSIADMIINRSISRQHMLTINEPSKKPKSEEISSKSANENAELLQTTKQVQFDLNIAKATQFDLQQNFELSESSYFQLIRHLQEVLEIDQINGTKSFDNLSVDAKQHLKVERNESCGMVIQKIRILKEMIQRKDELLQSYEKDLVKLKQAEDLTLKVQAQLENIVQQSRSKGEEVELLRETLNRTKDLLNEEKRLSNAIKQNKHYIQDKSLSQVKPPRESPKFHCPPEDILGKGKQVEKKKVEKIKRKDYEIKSLKSELYNKEKELSQATNRLYTLETTMGIKSEEPVP